jgi:hypothetical protein
MNNMINSSHSPSFAEVIDREVQLYVGLLTWKVKCVLNFANDCKS